MTGPATVQPPDIVSMRAATVRLLHPDATPDVLPPADAEVETLTAVLRDHVKALAPMVRREAEQLSAESIPRYYALACVNDALVRLRSQPEPGRYGGLVYARRLARALSALCDRYEALTRTP